VIGLIWCQNPDGIIGAGGTIPWRYPGDFRRFKRVTMGSTIVMGRKTWESIGRPLPGRQNVVVTSGSLSVRNVLRVSTIEDALRLGGFPDVWLVGGAKIYEAGMRFADVIDVTYVPDAVKIRYANPAFGCDPPPGYFVSDLVYAPAIDETLFEPGPVLPHEDEPLLTRRVYTRRSAS
jgi:dihydrofolate reductase